jgi:hypothetical protein
VHVDPVLAYDFMQLESRIPSGRLHDGRYIIVYGYGGRLDSSENGILRAYARSIDAEILCMGGVQGCCDRFIDCTPFELLAYFRDAEAIITDTFHGTIFSIINRKPFGTIIRRSVGHAYGNEEKLGFLLDTFGLSSRRLADVGRVSDLLAEPVQYDAVARILGRERTRAGAYLSSVIL